MKLDIHNLLEFFHQKKFDPSYDESRSQITMTMEIGTREIPMIFNIISEGLILQSIAYLPLEIPQKHISDVGRMLHLLNKQLDIPGFGMDEKYFLTFFRIVIPCLNKEIYENTIDMMFISTRLACDSFLTGIELVAQGTVSLDKVIKERDMKI